MPTGAIVISTQSREDQNRPASRAEHSEGRREQQTTGEASSQENEAEEGELPKGWFADSPEKSPSPTIKMLQELVIPLFCIHCLFPI